MNERLRRTEPQAPPRIFTVAAPYVADLLAGDPTITVHPHLWFTLEDFVDDAASRRLPLDEKFVVCVGPDAANGQVSFDEFLALFRDVTVVVHPGVTLDDLYDRLAQHLSGAAMDATAPPMHAPPAIDLTGMTDDATEWHFERPAAAAPAAPAPARADLDELLGDLTTQSLPTETAAPTSRRAAPRSVQRPLAPAAPAPMAQHPDPIDDDLLAGLGAYTSFGAPMAPPEPTPEPAPMADSTQFVDAASFLDAAPAYDAAPVMDPAPITFDPVAPRDVAPTFEPTALTFGSATTSVPSFDDMSRGPLAEDLRHDDYRLGESRIIAVYSPKGGVGKTSIAVNLAARLAHRTRLSVCIVDLDVGFGNVGTRLGVFTPTIRKLLVEPERDQESLARNLAYDEHSGLHALLAPLRPEAGADRKLLKPAVYDKILALLVDRFDVVFLDCSVELNDPLVAQFALKRAHEVVVVVNNEQATLLDARRAIEAMIRSTDAPRAPGLGLDREHIKIVLNQNVDGVGKDLDQIKVLLTGDDPNHPLNHVPIVSVIPDDRKLWVGHANLARPVATAGNADVDHALDAALDSVMRASAFDAPRPDRHFDTDDRYELQPREANPRVGGLLSRFRRRKD